MHSAPKKNEEGEKETTVSGDYKKIAVAEKQSKTVK